MQNLGIIVDNFGPSQIAYEVIKNCNKFLENRYDISLFGFFENVSRPLVNPNFALMNLTEVYGFEGTIVSTSAYQAYQIQNYPGPNRRILYAYDLDWLRPIGLPAEFFIDLYPRWEVWTRCEDYKKVLDNNYNIDTKVNETFDLERFL